MAGKGDRDTRSPNLQKRWENWDKIDWGDNGKEDDIKRSDKKVVRDEVLP